MIPRITGIQALDYEIMERDLRINRICNKAKRLYSQGIDPNDYIDEIFSEEGIEIDSLSNDEIRKINNSCR